MCRARVEVTAHLHVMHLGVCNVHVVATSSVTMCTSYNGGKTSPSFHPHSESTHPTVQTPVPTSYPPRHELTRVIDHLLPPPPRSVTGMSVVFTYLWHVTFFGGCMAVFGYLEEQGRHGITCRPVLPVSQSGEYGQGSAAASFTVR